MQDRQDQKEGLRLVIMEALTQALELENGRGPITKDLAALLRRKWPKREHTAQVAELTNPARFGPALDDKEDRAALAAENERRTFVYPGGQNVAQYTKKKIVVAPVKALPKDPETGEKQNDDTGEINVGTPVDVDNVGANEEAGLDDETILAGFKDLKALKTYIREEGGTIANNATSAAACQAFRGLLQ